MPTLFLFLSRHLIVCVLVVLLGIEAASLFWVGPGVPSLPSDEAVMQAETWEEAWQETSEETWLETGIDAPVLKLSEIDGPRIDFEAATITLSEAPATTEAPVTTVTTETTATAATLPGELWVLLILAYAALLVFNFSYTFNRVVAPQWGWEAFYTLAALWGWLVMDPTMLYPWFPLMILKTGLIIFALYAYLLERRLREEEKQPSLFVEP